MVQKIIDNEIINKYKINRCISTIPKKTVNNNLNGGDKTGDTLLSVITDMHWFWWRLIFYLFVSVLGGLTIQFTYNNRGYTSLFIIFCTMWIIGVWYFGVYKVSELKKKNSLQEQILYYILGSDAKLTQFHTVIIFSVLIF